MHPLIRRFLYSLASCLLAPMASGANTDFPKIIQPFFKEYCIKCHGPDKNKGKLVLHTIKDDFSSEDDSTQWIEILNQLTFGEMPPPDEKKRPGAGKTADVVEWINTRLIESGKAEGYLKKLLAPEYGNRINHEKLFSGEITTPPFSPSRLWRVSPAIFKQRNFQGRSPFSYVTGEKGIRDYAELSPVDRSTIQMLMINANKWLEQRLANNDFKEFSNDLPTPSARLIEETAQNQFVRVIRRQPSKEEVAKYAGLLTHNIKIGGNMDGLLTTIKTMFLSPEAIYRTEFGLGETDQHGRRHLSPAEIAYAVAYAGHQGGDGQGEIVHQGRRCPRGAWSA